MIWGADADRLKNIIAYFGDLVHVPPGPSMDIIPCPYMDDDNKIEHIQTDVL